jgi:phosphotriesterase-related protein
MASVRTVLGEISPDELGITLSHEHLLLDTAHLFWERPGPDDPPEIHAVAEAPVTRENFDLLAERPYVSRDNLEMTELDLAIRELQLFKDAGGQSFIDVSGRIPGWHPDALIRASEETGINIVASTGWYIAPSHPLELEHASIDEIAEMFIGDIEVGIAGTDVRAGMIGELGMTEPLHPQEEKVLRAGARAQRQTRVPLTVHPMVFMKEAHRYIDILESEGANLEKVYMSHMDGSCPDLKYQESVMDRGVAIDYDLFRDSPWNDSHLIFGGDHWISDRERVETLAQLCADGYSNQIMLAHDLCLKIHFVEYGGKGWAYILNEIVPQLRQAGVTDEQLNNMLVETPKRIFAV